MNEPQFSLFLHVPCFLLGMTSGYDDEEWNSRGYCALRARDVICFHGPISKQLPSGESP